MSNPTRNGPERHAPGRTGLTALQEEWTDLPEVKQARSDAAVRRLVFQLIEHPVCSAQQAAERLGVSRRAARDALEALTDVGVLNRTTAARNLQVYEASEVFALIDDLERAIADDIAAPGALPQRGSEFLAGGVADDPAEP